MLERTFTQFYIFFVEKTRDVFRGKFRYRYEFGILYWYKLLCRYTNMILYRYKFLDRQTNVIFYRKSNLYRYLHCTPYRTEKISLHIPGKKTVSHSFISDCHNKKSFAKNKQNKKSINNLR